MANHKPPRVHVHAYERLNRLCMEIHKGRYPTKAELARAVERHPRTIQRDLVALRDQFDAPLIFDRRQNGYRFTDTSWQLPLPTLSQGELIAFFASERMLRRLGATSEARLSRAALKKLAALLPEEVTIDLAALDEAISFAPEPILDASPDTLRKLAAAAMNHQTLHVHYYSQHRAARTERDVDVLALHNHLGEWYAVCYDHESGEVRDFHAGRMLSLRETRRKFEPPEGWDADEYLRGGFGMFRGGKEVVVEVEFDSYQARYARERKFHPTERHREMSDGRLRVSFKTTEGALEQVARWVLQYGSHALVIAPAELRKLVHDEIESMRAMYAQG